MQLTLYDCLGALPNPKPGDDLKSLPPKIQDESPKKDDTCPVHGSEKSNCCRIPIAHQVRFVSGSKEDNPVKVK